jgi:hypothetical protein
VPYALLPQSYIGFINFAQLGGNNMCFKSKRNWYRIIWSWGQHGATFTDYFQANSSEEAIKMLRKENTAVPEIVVRGVSEPLTPPCWRVL